MRVSRGLVLGIAVILALAGCREEADDFAPVGAQGEGLGQAACVESGGRWGEGGVKGFMVCYRDTGESEKACSTSGDCKGFCLARSRTCAPVTPLFGCNQVLGATGAESEVCIQ